MFSFPETPTAWRASSWIALSFYSNSYGTDAHLLCSAASCSGSERRVSNQKVLIRDDDWSPSATEEERSKRTNDVHGNDQKKMSLKPSEDVTE